MLKKIILFSVLALSIFELVSDTHAGNVVFTDPIVNDIYFAMPTNLKDDVNATYPKYYWFGTGNYFSTQVLPANLSNYCKWKNNGTGTGTYVGYTTTGATTQTMAYFNNSWYLTYSTSQSQRVKTLTCFYADPPSCNTTLPACYSASGCNLTYAPTSSNQSWVKGSNSCGYTCTNGYVWPTCSVLPVNITWYFDNATYDYQTYTWNMTLHVSTGAMVENVSDIQVWNWFTTTAIAGITSNPVDPKIVFSIKKTDDNSVAPCSSYSYTIPAGKLVWLDGYSTNAQAIQGSFSLIGCAMPASISWSLSVGVEHSWSFLSGAMTGDFIPWSVADNSGNTFISQEGLYLILRNVILFVVIVFTMIVLVKKAFAFFSGKHNIWKHF